MEDFHEITSARSKDYLRALPFRKRKDLNELCNVNGRQANPLAVDLMKRCLSFSPKRRITVEEALTHPYLEVSLLVAVGVLVGGC